MFISIQTHICVLNINMYVHVCMIYIHIYTHINTYINKGIYICYFWFYIENFFLRLC